MAKLVTIYGGAGFLGRYIARRMAKDGWRIRVAVRRPNEAMHVKPYGNVGQVEPVFANIRDDATVRETLNGADAVINCVGTFDVGGKNNMDAVMATGAGRVARLAAEAGVASLTHISAIGADPEGDSHYARSKAAGESAVTEAFPGTVILRPSIMFGPEDQFFNRFAGMSQLGPVLPIFGAETKFQPVYVDDVARAAVLAAEGKAEPGVYELGGPDVNTFRELMQQMLDVINRRRLIANLPMAVGNAAAIGGWLANYVSFGAIPAPVTRDQLRQLKVDNVVAEGARGFDALGIEPQAMEAILPDYLWRFRPSGQYAEIKASARNL